MDVYRPQSRRFRRDGREQLTGLVNGHAGAVIPGEATSVNAVVSQFEREQGEFIVGCVGRERAVREVRTGTAP
jgi:hypothetical protein